jgi:hypothetical protein
MKAKYITALEAAKELGVMAYRLHPVGNPKRKV